MLHLPLGGRWQRSCRKESRRAHALRLPLSLRDIPLPEGDGEKTLNYHKETL